MENADHKTEVTLQKADNSGRIAYRKELYQRRQEETNEEQIKGPGTVKSLVTDFFLNGLFYHSVQPPDPSHFTLRPLNRSMYVTTLCKGTRTASYTLLLQKCIVHTTIRLIFLKYSSSLAHKN